MSRLNGSRRRFNEAGAVMPRKVAIAMAACEVPHGFNEAGAVMPRKGPPALATPPEAEASMRPGLLCPGSEVRG